MPAIVLQIASAVLGAATSLYLAAQHNRLKSGIQEGPSFCSLGQGFDCDTVSASSWAEFAGVSLGIWGWLFFTFVLVTLLVFPPSQKAHGKLRRALTWLVSIALVFDVALLGVQLFSIKNVCILCLLTYVANLGLLAGFIWETACETGQAWGASIRQLYTQKRGAKFGGNGVAMTVVFYTILAGGGWLWVSESTKPEKTAEAPAQITPDETKTFKDIWEIAPRKDIVIRPTDSVKGPASAKVKVVVFSDFECPFCKRAAFTLGKALDGYKGQVQLVYKHFPLDSACNPEMDRPMHPNACLLAHLSYCANQKGKFWPFHDRVYFDFDEKDIRAPLPELTAKLNGLFTKEEITACVKNEAALNATRLDIQMGQKLELRGTPAIFVNGKHFSIPLSQESIRQVVDWEIGG